MSNPTWTLQPTNEGKELNYIETFQGSTQQAKQYADNMRIRLQAAMHNGLIRIVAKNYATNREFTVE